MPVHSDAERERRNRLYLAQLIMKRHRTTDKAVLLSTSGQIDDAIWLPNSQLTMTPTADRRWIFYVTMPEWLATKHKLLSNFER